MENTLKNNCTRVASFPGNTPQKKAGEWSLGMRLAHMHMHVLPHSSSLPTHPPTHPHPLQVERPMLEPGVDPRQPQQDELPPEMAVKISSQNALQLTFTKTSLRILTELVRVGYSRSSPNVVLLRILNHIISCCSLVRVGHGSFFLQCVLLWTLNCF